VSNWGEHPQAINPVAGVVVIDIVRQALDPPRSTAGATVRR